MPCLSGGQKTSSINEASLSITETGRKCWHRTKVHGNTCNHLWPLIVKYVCFFLILWSCFDKMFLKTNPSWARGLWQHQTCEPWGNAAAESPVCHQSAPAPVWTVRLPPPPSLSSWPAGLSATTPASPPSRSVHPSPGGKKQTDFTETDAVGQGEMLVYTCCHALFVFHLLHGVARQFVARPKDWPMILHGQMLQLRPHGLLLLRHHTIRSGLQKDEWILTLSPTIQDHWTPTRQCGWFKLL